MPGRPATNRPPATPKHQYPRAWGPRQPPPPKPTSHRPSLSHLLTKTAFIIKCKLHDLPVRGIPRRIDYLKEKMKTLRSHNCVNDLGMLEADVNRHWIKLESAMGRAERESFGIESLRTLAKVLVDFGARKRGWKVELNMDEKGSLEVLL